MRRASIVRAAAVAIASVVGGALAPLGCSSASSDASQCQSSKCLRGNECIATPDEKASGQSQCRFPCATHADCPMGYHCDANAGGTSPFCAADATAVTATTGIWGDPCTASKGSKDPACDLAEGFECYGTSPTDGNAFCTIPHCAQDADCGHGFFCATVNLYPNADDPKPTTGETTTVCLPHVYCSPCQSDIDCTPLNGAPQHCVQGADNASFCAPECTSGSQCARDATCAQYDNFAACTPRAGVCKGDGGFCSPCRSDADCTNGLCVHADYSTERFCSVHSQIPCSLDASGNLVAKCPSKPEAGATTTYTCTLPKPPNTPGEPLNPPNECVGEVADGVDQGQTIYAYGCWSRH